MAHHHRAGAQKQSNKRHKSNNSSKRALNRKQGGKINVQSTRPPIKSKSISAKVSQKAKQHAKRAHLAKVQSARRRIPGALLYDNSTHNNGSNTVVNVGIVNISTTTTNYQCPMESSMRDFLLRQCVNTSQENANNNSSTHASSSQYGVMHKQKCRILTTEEFTTNANKDSQDDNRIIAALDLARVCQVLIFLLHPNPNYSNAPKASNTNNASAESLDDALLSETGERILHAVRAQGLPSKCYAVLLSSSINSSDKNKRNAAAEKELKKYAQRLVTTEIMPSVKLFDIAFDDSDKNGNNAHMKAQVNLLTRSIANGLSNEAKWACIRPYIVSDAFSYDAAKEEMTLQGYIQGNVPFNVQDLVHIPYMGTFQAKYVRFNSSKCANNGAYKEIQDTAMEGGIDEVVIESKEDGGESLRMFATPDALDGEQNLIGFEDDDNSMNGEDDLDEDVDNNAKMRPNMWSDYQASWLEGVPQEKVQELMMDDEEMDDQNTVSDPFNSKTSSASMVDDNTINVTKQQFRDEATFPDEIELPQDVAARTRLERYRSLKHFKDSTWDPMEQLPGAYGKLYAFGGGFKSIERDVLEAVERRVIHVNNKNLDVVEEQDDGSISKNEFDETSEEEEEQIIFQKCIPAGTYVILVLKNVTSEHIERGKYLKILTAVSLLQHENKASVCHMNVQMGNTCEPGDIPVKSKDVLTIRCGWRTWKCRPIFSENNLNADKHKFSRFLTPHAHLCCSAYGPVTFGNAPVLIFRESTEQNARRQLIAIGTTGTSNPNRIIIKRAILTGYPTRVHKRHAVVRYMFFNPDDVKWFQPAQLTTKHGLVGNIVESVGEHGTMKCLFNKGIQQHDTVCLVLYKRVYPKYVDKEGDGDDLVVL